MNPISQSITPDENPVTYRKTMTSRMAIGAFLGLVWGASLRAWMALLALELGESLRFTWAGTFGAILFPTAFVGAVLGVATYDAETSERKRWRWVILSPLLLIVGPVIVTDNFFTTLIKTGMGGGSIGVALIGVLGGYTFSGSGARWTRRVSGFLTLLLTVASILPVYYAAPSSATTISMSKIFGALLFVFLMMALIAGVSAPSRYQPKSKK